MDLSNIENWDTFLLRYPGIILSGSRARGTVKIKNKWYRLRLNCPYFPHLKDFSLEIQQPQKNTLAKISNNDLQTHWTVYDVMENLPILYNDCGFAFSSKEEKPVTTNIYQAIADLYAPERYLLELDDLCTRLRFSKFEENEQHYLQIELPSLKISDHSLPSCFAWEEQLQKYDNISAIVQQFQKYIQDLQPFYENFADIDELCYVVQPRPPVSTKCNWRIFVLRERVYLKLVIADPFASMASMSIQIIGPTQAVEELRRTLSEGLSTWDAELDIHKNLLRIFNLCYFPMPPGSGWLGGEADNASTEPQFCNICYSYQLDEGQIPIVSCDNIKCTMIYHAACLKEWFNTLSDGKDFLSVSFGACPFCKTVSFKRNLIYLFVKYPDARFLKIIINI
ncbi:E3 ubiquitin-protein ligase FANCL isoform X1 [Ceratitis capitata]|uniref:E3 ubiquitin-protein ligase FANCL isoform X1 n=1 Tax=Ceratitis capitata TaxID=7213 RepID=UPI000A0FDC66|nr:E3 ubiquitin-protein ligase FANCL isoform X1 [Ceratitis capitata]